MKRIVDDLDSQELLQAARSKVYKKGKRTATTILDKALSSPSASKKMKATLKPCSSMAKSLSPDEALRLLVDGDFTKRQYKAIREVNKEFFPAYNKVLAAKKCTYPEDVTVSEASAAVSLKALLEHTVSRLLLVVEKKLTGKLRYNKYTTIFIFADLSRLTNRPTCSSLIRYLRIFFQEQILS